jgi:hypothetical protein
MKLRRLNHAFFLANRGGVPEVLIYLNLVRLGQVPGNEKGTGRQDARVGNQGTAGHPKARFSIARTWHA